MMNLDEVADEITHRLVNLFRKDSGGCRPVLGDNNKFQSDPNWRDYLPFNEYFHGDSGRGLGASHQTGWTALVVSMIYELAEKQEAKKSQSVSAIPARGD